LAAQFQWRRRDAIDDMIPAPTAALSEAPVDATVRAANALGGVAP